MAAERMNDSILVSIKKMLGLPDEYDAFDLDIITHINSAFDPPMSSAVLECYKTQANEYEWRLKTMAENQEVNNQNE